MKEKEAMSISNNESLQNQTTAYAFKVLLIGDKGVGKTQLIKRLVDEDTNGDQPTIGVDFKSKKLTLERNKACINLSFYDTSGDDEQFKEITRSYFSNIQAFLICYDMSNYQTYVNCQYWLDEIDKYYYTSDKDKADASKKLIKVLVGCKSDSINNRQSSSMCVPTKKAKEFAKKKSFCLFIETSSKNNLNVKELFEELSMELISNYVKFLNYQQSLLGFENRYLTALSTKTDAYINCNPDTLNCDSVVLNNSNEKRKSIKTFNLLDLLNF
jgi:small GTP-binding protein